MTDSVAKCAMPGRVRQQKRGSNRPVEQICRCYRRNGDKYISSSARMAELTHGSKS